MTDIIMLLGILASGFMDNVDCLEFGMTFFAFDFFDISGKRIPKRASEFLARMVVRR